MVKSPEFSLNREDLKRVLRNTLIMYGPVVLMLLDQIQAGTIDIRLLLACFVGISADIIRRYIREVE